MPTVDRVLDHEIIIATTKEHIQQCLDVRIQVFHHEQKFPLETEIDELLASLRLVDRTVLL